MFPKNVFFSLFVNLLQVILGAINERMSSLSGRHPTMLSWKKWTKQHTKMSSNQWRVLPISCVFAVSVWRRPDQRANVETVHFTNFDTILVSYNYIHCWRNIDKISNFHKCFSVKPTRECFQFKPFCLKLPYSFFN
jgi:hypothetical protein